MMNKVKIVYLLGIGGIGMSALARYFNLLNCEVSGYDKTSTELTNALVKEGIHVHFEDEISFIPRQVLELPADEVLVIYTPAIPKDHKQLNYLISKGIKLNKRSAILGMITSQNHNVAVAGTHGKTTTSTMIAHILTDSGIRTNAFLGGISGNYNTNLLLNENAETTVLEADEYDRSFLQLSPDIAIITLMDPDHLDIYGIGDEMAKSYNEFAAQVKPTGTLIYKYGLLVNSKVNTFTYGLNSKADYYASNIRIQNGKYKYDLVTPEHTISDIEVGLPGRHNVENSVAASAASLIKGVSESDLKKAIAGFKGAKRRFEYIINNEKLVFIDDYAHHPEELRACIQSVRELYGNKKITGIFQPHLFSRTRDFADGFASSLDLLDKTFLLDIYPARELPIVGVDSNMLLQRMKSVNKSLVTKDNLINEIMATQPEVLVTLGAGDIDKLVEPIKNALLN